MKTRKILARTLMALTLAAGGCASQTEMARLQQELVDLRKELAYEKQRQAERTERLNRAQENIGAGH